MTKFAAPITSTRLDTKAVPDLSDLTLAEIKHLVKADTAVHSLMANYMVRPQYIGMQVANSHDGGASSGYAYAHAACLVPPKVGTCYLQVLASASSGSVLVRSKTIAGVVIHSVNIEMTGDVELVGGVDAFSTAEEWYRGHLKKAQTYTTPTELGLVTSPSWDPVPVHLEFDTQGDVRLFGCLVQFIYKSL